jgi:hypothetical protein
MQGQTSLDKCANKDCSAEFTTFGAGELFVFPVTNGSTWNPPLGAKQKVLWLCDKCCRDLSIRLDHDTGLAEVVPVIHGKAA